MQSKPDTTAQTDNQIRFQAQLLNSDEQSVIATDLTGRIIVWNQFAERLYGWNADEALGRSLTEFISTPSSPAQSAELMARLQGGERWSGDLLVQQRDGATLSTHVIGSPVLDEQGALIGMLNVSHNSAAWKKLQEANRLLAGTEALFSASPNDELQLNMLAQLAVSQIADWCAVHMLKADGSIAQVALAHANPTKLQAARECLAYPPLNDDAYGLPGVLRSGEPKLVSEVTEELLAAAVDEAQRRAMLAAEVKSYMIVPLIARPRTLGTITFVAAESGRRFDVSALALAENFASHIAVNLEKTRLYRESQRLNAELEQRVSERTAELSAAVAQLQQSEDTVQTLFRISKKLNATLDVDTILEELAQEAISIVNGESGFAGLRTADGMSLRKYFRAGVAIAFEHTWRTGQDIPGWVLQHKVPYGTSDAANDPVMLHALAINADVRSLICTPILDSAGEVLGYFYIRNQKAAEGFTLADQDMLMALSPVASIAIQNALAYQQRLSAESELQQSYQQLRALADNLQTVREEERTRIARELHDQLGQALTALKLDLSMLIRRLVKKDAALGAEAKAFTTQIDTMIKIVRRIATELRPGMLDDLGLAASIEWQARDFQKRTGIQCAASVPEHDPPLSRAQSIALFRIFQETLTNITRHAEAQHVNVTLDAANDAAVLQVRDDGRGIQSDKIAGTRSLGLLGMRERVALLGGAFDIRGRAGEGTTVMVTIPFNSTNDLR